MNADSFDLILKFKERLIKACQSNDIDEVHKIFSHIVPIYDEIKNFEGYSTMENFSFFNAIVNSFSEACSFGHLSTVKIFVESEHLKNIETYNKFPEQRFTYYSNDSLIAAASNGHSDIVKYLCETKLKKHLSFYLKSANLLMHASKEGHLDMVKFLFNDPNISPIIKSMFNNNGLCQSLEKACDYGHLDIVKYLLTSSDLEYKANVHIDDDAPFKAANFPATYHVLEYLVFDYDIKITKNIEEIIHHDAFVRSLFETRELNKELNSGLKNTNAKQGKIKL